MGSFSIVGSFSYLGFSLGMILAILLGYVVVIQGRKVDLTSFFRVTTLLLVLFASGMVAYGTHEAEEFMVKGKHLHWLGLEDKQLENGTTLKEEAIKSGLIKENVSGNPSSVSYTHLRAHETLR